MIKVSRKLDYAVLAVSHFCLNKGQVVSARTISEVYRIPLPILANILKLLAKRAIIDSVRGVGGGYVFAMNPEDLTLGELARIVEGPFRLADCVAESLVPVPRRLEAKPSDEASGCAREGYCP
ncbi:MAG: Rrf2 family transcriptional regulator, partial [Planctomycetota bacterium]